MHWNNRLGCDSAQMQSLEYVANQGVQQLSTKDSTVALIVIGVEKGQGAR